MMSQINGLSDEVLIEELWRCCGSRRWADLVMQNRPFESMQHLLAVADRSWWSLEGDDWRTAFLAHPRIGDVDALKEKYAKNPDAWEGGEQSGADDASDATLNALKEGNDAYYNKFGHLFLICATGKSAQEMLNALNERIGNRPDAELLIAAGEQGKISHLRLNKLIATHTNSQL
jgi:2-oxo-4-hydroxy-4-carboxy-5-ureidoimidazoline decarboxylase